MAAVIVCCYKEHWEESSWRGLLQTPICCVPCSTSIKRGLGRQPLCESPSSGDVYDSETGKGAKLEKQKPPEGNRKNPEMCTQQVPWGRDPHQASPREPDYRNPKSRPHTTNPGSFSNALVFLVLFCFILRSIRILHLPS